MIAESTDNFGKYEHYKNIVDERLKEYLKEYSDNNIKGTNEHIYYPIEYLLNAGGKRIRPVLMMLCCEIAGGKKEDCLDAAIAIEMLHNFTLVHDDIMDRADTRRGLETIHKKWTINTAILSGDALLGISYNALLNTKSERIKDILKIFTNGVIEVCEGQAMDKEFENNDTIGLSDYLLMIRKKTSELVRVCSVVGGIAGNANEKQLSNLSNYAENIGLAFQIQDDMLDVYSKEIKFGKKSGGDIIEKKKTYLYLKVLEIASDNDKVKLKEIYQSYQIDSKKVDEVIDIYNRYEISEYAKETIKKYTRNAINEIGKFENTKSKDMLVWFSNMLLNRTY